MSMQQSVLGSIQHPLTQCLYPMIRPASTNTKYPYPVIWSASNNTKCPFPVICSLSTNTKYLYPDVTVSAQEICPLQDMDIIIKTHYCMHRSQPFIVFLHKMKNKNRRLLNWSLMLQEYNLQIEHVKWKDNNCADALSRNCV